MDNTALEKGIGPEAKKYSQVKVREPVGEGNATTGYSFTGELRQRQNLSNGVPSTEVTIETNSEPTENGREIMASSSVWVQTFPPAPNILLREYRFTKNLDGTFRGVQTTTKSNGEKDQKALPVDWDATNKVLRHLADGCDPLVQEGYNREDLEQFITELAATKYPVVEERVKQGERVAEVLGEILDLHEQTQ